VEEAFCHGSWLEEKRILNRQGCQGTQSGATLGVEQAVGGQDVEVRMEE